MPPHHSIPKGTGWSNRTITKTATTITTVVSTFVSYCTEATTFTVNGVCYTATKPGHHVTVTDCPCTIETVSPVFLSLLPSPFPRTAHSLL